MKEEVIRPFDSLSEIYNKEPYSEVSVKRAVDVVKYFQRIGFRPKTILDIGCGCGNGTRVLQNNGNLVVGIDLSKKALNIASAKSRDSKLVSFAQQDMRFLGFRPNSFEAITSFYDSLNYIDPKELDKIFVGSNRLLQQGGLVILNYLNPVAFQDVEQNPDSIYQGDSFYFLSKASKKDKNEIELDLIAFVRKSGTDSYKILKEKHRLFLFTNEEMVICAIKNGFEVVGVVDGENWQSTTQDSWHSIIIAKKC